MFTLEEFTQGEFSQLKTISEPEDIMSNKNQPDQVIWRAKNSDLSTIIRKSETLL